MDESDREKSELLKKIAFTRAKYQESLRRNHSLESELLAAEEALAGLRQKFVPRIGNAARRNIIDRFCINCAPVGICGPSSPHVSSWFRTTTRPIAGNFEVRALPLRPTARLMGAVAS